MLKHQNNIFLIKLILYYYKKLYSLIGCATPSRGWYVDIRSELMFDESDKKCCQRKQNEVCRIWTRKFEKVKIVDNKTLQNGHAHGADNDKKNDCLVMVHGLGAGGALFALNFDGLSKHFTVYCLDLPGRFKLPVPHSLCVGS
jgi:hypothetical protein